MRALVIALVLLVGCHEESSLVYPTSPTLDISKLPLGPGDKIEVVIFSGSHDAHTTYTLDSSGEIAVQYIGAVAAGAKTVKQVQDEVKDRLSDGYLINPIVSINVVELNSQTLSVLGQVARSGTIKFTPGLTITEAIAQSGGFSPLARKNMVRVTRFTTDGTKQIWKIPVEEIAEGAKPNMSLLPGDEIFVPERPW